MTVIVIMKYGYVYRIDTPPFGKWVDGAFYIGRHKGDVVNDGYFGSGVIIKNYINAHGVSGLVKTVLCWARSHEELNSLETLFIRKFWGDPKLLNQHTGGRCPLMTEEHRRKLSESLHGKNTGHKSEETKAKISKTLTGRKQGPKSEETKRKLRESNLGKKHRPPSVESREAMKKRYAEAKRLVDLENVRYENKSVPKYTRPNKPHKKLSAEDSARKSKQFTGMRFYNNGKISVRALECPDGFVAGRLGLKHYENLMNGAGMM